MSAALPRLPLTHDVKLKLHWVDRLAHVLIALIALVLFVVAGIVLRCSDWPRTRPLAGGVLVVSGTMAYTAWSEWFNVYRLGSWGCTESMPLVFGIGLSPWLQWLVLPPLMIVVFRKLAPSLLNPQSYSKPKQ